jgi:hypothetical protein
MKWWIFYVAVIASLLENFGLLALIYALIRW